MSQSVNLQRILLALGDRAEKVKVKIINTGAVRIKDGCVEFQERPSCVSVNGGDRRKQIVEENRKKNAQDQIVARREHKRL